MTTKRLTIDADDVDFDETTLINGTADDISGYMDDIDGELNSVTSEFGKDKNDVNLKIKIHRVLERKGEREWLFDILPSELPIMDRIRDEYGGGKYEAVVFKNGKIFRKFSFTIATPKPNNQIKTLSTDLANIVQMMGQQQQTNFAQLKELMLVKNTSSVPATQPFNMMEMMTGMLGMMAQIKNLTTSPLPVNSASDSLDQALKIVQLINDRDSGGGGETTMLDLARDLIKSPLLGQLTASAIQLPDLSNQVPVTQKLALNKPVAQNNQPIKSPEGASMINPILKGYINQLVKKAVQGSDPALYAEFILDNVDESVVRQYLTRDDLMSFITSINPAAANYSEWFNALKSNILEILNSPDDESLTDDAVSNDTSAHEPANTAESVDGTTSG